MKKIILLFLSVMLLVACDNANVPTVNEPEVIDDSVIEVPGELIIKNKGFSKRFEIEKYEEDLFVEEGYININYLSVVDRFEFDFNESEQLLVMVYHDQTFYINFVDETIEINGEEIIDNDFVYKKIDTLYLNVDRFTQYFDIEWLVIEEPFFSLQMDFSDVKELPISDYISLLPDKINMTWEAVYSAPTKVENLYEMPGLDVISPVWYHLKDADGSIESKKQNDYLEWANEMNYTLWPAVTNNFDPDMTSILLNDPMLRKQFIDDLTNEFSNNGFPGINIDFENIYLEDRDALSQFIAELTASFHRKHMIVSMDVTFAGGSDNWSRCYDRTVLGQWVDFIVVMSYDQHWGSSPVSGTVAGMDWLNTNLGLLTQEVNPEKIIMGIPFYMRVWFERPSKDQVNQMKVTSDAITMHGMENILESRQLNQLWDEKNGQYYVSYIDAKDNALKKIWIEDETSLKLKVALVHDFNLKGIASWRRGYELETVWSVINNELRR